MGLPSWPILIGAASFGGIAIGTMGLLLHKQMDKIANEANFVRRALTITREKPAMKQLVGEKIEVGRATLADDFGKLDETNIQIRLPIKGENDKAFLMAYARKKDPSDKFRLFKLEAEFSKIKGKKLILLDRSDEDPKTDEEWEEEQTRLDREKAKAKEPKSAKELAEEERQRVKSMTNEERKQYYLNKMKEMQPVDSLSYETVTTDSDSSR